MWFCEYRGVDSEEILTLVTLFLQCIVEKKKLSQQMWYSTLNTFFFIFAVLFHYDEQERNLQIKPVFSKMYQ